MHKQVHFSQQDIESIIELITLTNKRLDETKNLTRVQIRNLEKLREILIKTMYLVEQHNYMMFKYRLMKDNYNSVCSVLANLDIDKK